METAFLMVGLQTLVRPLLVWVCVFVCVSGIGDVSCKIVWLFVAVVTSMCEFQLFAACTCADSASSAAARLPGNLRPSLHGPSSARRSPDETL